MSLLEVQSLVQLVIECSVSGDLNPMTLAINLQLILISAG